jgi:hypothetical protein
MSKFLNILIPVLFVVVEGFFGGILVASAPPVGLWIVIGFALFTTAGTIVLAADLMSEHF